VIVRAAAARASGRFVVAVFFVWSGGGLVACGATGGSHCGVGSESERACQVRGFDRFGVAVSGGRGGLLGFSCR